MKKTLSIFTTLLIILAFAGNAVATSANPYGIPPELKAKADSGDPEALYMVAAKYYMPHIKKVDYTDEAEGDISGGPDKIIVDQKVFALVVRTLEESGSKNFYEAYSMLGELFSGRIENKTDLKKSINYYIKGANGGHVGCLINLSYIYAADIGTRRQDRAKAYACTQIIHELDPEPIPAMQALEAKILKKMTPQEKQAAAKIVERWKTEKIFE